MGMTMTQKILAAHAGLDNGVFSETEASSPLDIERQHHGERSVFEYFVRAEREDRLNGIDSGHEAHWSRHSQSVRRGHVVRFRTFGHKHSSLRCLLLLLLLLRQ